jgi:hypothetical protein
MNREGSHTTLASGLFMKSQCGICDRYYLNRFSDSYTNTDTVILVGMRGL